MSTILLIFNHFEFNEAHLKKDVFLVPYYLGLNSGAKVIILYPSLPNNQNLPNIYRGVELKPIRYRKNLRLFPFWKHINFYLQFIKEVSNTDLLIRFHLSLHTELFTILYKVLKPNGKVYVKLDTNAETVNSLYVYRNVNLKSLVHKAVIQYFIKKVDIFSCETKESYSRFLESNNPHLSFGERLLIIPNGFDELVLKEMNLGLTDFSQKENVIITVGRLGSEEKNTELLLRALGNVDLGSWKVIFIGSIDDALIPKIEEFYKQNDVVKDRVVFTGPIYDTNELFGFYNRSKVFVLTSNWEGYPIVFPEAMWFNNYLLSTPVAAAFDIIEEKINGMIFPFNDDETLSSILNKIVSGQINVHTDWHQSNPKLSWFSILKIISERLNFN